MRKKTLVILSLIALVATGLVTGCDLSCGEEVSVAMEILEYELVTDESGITRVVGVVKNTSNVALDSVELTVQFFNDNFDLIYEGSDFVEHLEIGETWSFEVIYQGSDVPSSNYAIVAPSQCTVSGGLWLP